MQKNNDIKTKLESKLKLFNGDLEEKNQNVKTFI